MPFVLHRIRWHSFKRRNQLQTVETVELLVQRERSGGVICTIYSATSLCISISILCSIGCELFGFNLLFAFFFCVFSSQCWLTSVSTLSQRRFCAMWCIKIIIGKWKNRNEDGRNKNPFSIAKMINYMFEWWSRKPFGISFGNQRAQLFHYSNM